MNESQVRTLEQVRQVARRRAWLLSGAVTDPVMLADPRLVRVEAIACAPINEVIVGLPS